ncbi:hypothetical protein EH240_04690 [Mesorhizobium tamadayense]|uniref:Uncharacterized protein n=1 Tax=Mesorhizobium tamadayense TaxID=425306 RepID=A0A3P3G4R0_9HYPH|nr:hypothetical protein [Mesorhizobium tamadayense]RRI05845.1 hypothetical protein EH240_04690 [Mesorhizobium tamadayense]
MTFTQAAAAFNHDRIGESPVRTLSPGVVAQMTRFGLTPKVLVNHWGLRSPLIRSDLPESGNDPTEMRRAGRVASQTVAAESPSESAALSRHADFSAIMAPAC